MTTGPLTDLTDDELRVLGRWLHGIRGPGIVDPDLPVDPDAEPTDARPAGVRRWAGDRLADVAAEQARRNRG